MYLNQQPKNHNSFLGYDSLTDFIESILGVKHYVVNLWLSFVAIISTFITGYIYNDAAAVYFLIFLCAIDFSTGVWKAMKSKTFKSTRFPRAFVSMLIYCLMLSISWKASTFSTFFIWLPSTIYGGLTGTLIISIFENLSALGFINLEFLNTLKDKLNIFKKVDK